jgi:regulator of PEP synthase PpsR (kinase-PPPase family)
MTSESPGGSLQIVIISGGTGRTASEVVNSALAQFEQADVQLVKKTNVRTRNAVVRIVRGISHENAVVLHSLVSPTVRSALVEEAGSREIPTVDVLGPTIAVIADQLGQVPRGKPGRSYQRQKDHIDRVAAVDFTLKHDDGAGLATLHEADVVLVGVSRSSKSVTCFYLAYRGIRAANVPLIAGLDPPRQLTDLPPPRVVGLMITPQRLHAVRQVRRGRFGDHAMKEYAEAPAIADELRHARHLIQQHGWRSIDVSYMAVEEVAAQVRQMIGRT